VSTATLTEPRPGVLGTLRDIYHERTHFDFVGRSWLWALISGTAVLVSAAALLLAGLNLGIDFNGGTQWQFTVHGRSASASDVRSALKGTGASDPKILILGNSGVRVQTSERKGSQQAAVTAALARYARTTNSDVSVTDVGPTWGDTVSHKAIVALIVFFALISVYLTARFEWKMALAALIAVVHDIVITVGVYAITGFEVTPATVVAFLTILGFSLYDTVVVFDKIRENTPSLGTERGDTYSAMVNRSMNAVLMRSINTSFVALLPVASLLIVGSGILGAVTLRDFALALFVGLLSGAYSSIFVATPILAWLKEREPRNRSIRERSAAQLAREGPVPTGARQAVMAPEPVDVGSPPVEGTRPDARPPAPVAPRPSPPRPAPGGVAPRARQQRRRKRR
jgi:preprotein translocase subunit SecF